MGFEDTTGITSWFLKRQSQAEHNATCVENKPLAVEAIDLQMDLHEKLI